MQEYLIIIGKTILFFVVLVITMRVMGKREVGELSVFDLVVFFVISELLSLSISETEDNPLRSIIPIIVMILLQKIVSYIVLKSRKLRDLIDGTPVFIIKNGIIDQKAMKDNHYNIDDLMLQMRSRDIDTPSKIKFAILENDGFLSIIAKDPNNVHFPDPLIKDGEIDHQTMKDINKTRTWLLEELRKLGYDDISKIFLCMYESDGLYVVLKQPL